MYSTLKVSFMRTQREFFSRTLDEQRWMLEDTWCDTCYEADLGMVDPQEYEEKGKIYVEGRCKKCGEHILNEIVIRDV